jgi:alkylated DNA repair protein (DNA oxidative demethylase)
VSSKAPHSGGRSGHSPRGPSAHSAAPLRGPGLVWEPKALSAEDRVELGQYLAGLKPLWEQRYSHKRPLPEGQTQRSLLRPVYWLGNWQFACLGYFEPPHKLYDRAVRAETFPPVIERIVERAHQIARKRLPAEHIPRGWRLNTCLINFYGSRKEGQREADLARVGEHFDREPGPVASLSLGERALFQFVRPGQRNEAPARSLWLEEGGLLVFSGPTWKDGLLHRVLRVEDKARLDMEPRLPDFRIRRINLTFRYVPEEYIRPYASLGATAKGDIAEYVSQLGVNSPHWAAAQSSDGGAHL